MLSHYLYFWFNPLPLMYTPFPLLLLYLDQNLSLNVHMQSELTWFICQKIMPRNCLLLHDLSKTYFHVLWAQLILCHLTIIFMYILLFLSTIQFVLFKPLWYMIAIHLSPGTAFYILKNFCFLLLGKQPRLTQNCIYSLDIKLI